MLGIDWHKAAMYIGGLWVDGESRLRVLNPATLLEVGSVPDGGAEAARGAVEAAHGAWRGWAELPAVRRSALLVRWYDLILAHRDELAALITAEQGKPRSEAVGEVEYAASFVLWYAEEAKRSTGEWLPASAAQKRILVMRQPVGVVAAITPWNFPAAMVTRKLAPALAAGCTVVIKPAEQTPLTAVALVALAAEAGFPPGTVNLVTGSPAAIGQVFLTDPRVRKISFTGSTEVGKLLMRGAADQVKRLSLELGGHAPFLVFADADLDAAVAGAVASKFRNAGQTCVCANRFLVEAPVYELFAERLAAAVEGLRVGPGTEPGVTVGPLIDEAAQAKVMEHVREALSGGARLLCGGGPVETGLPGRFFAPTILADVSPAMLVAREETFGPVAPIIPFRTEEEAVALANDSPYGLAAYAFTRDLGRAIRVAERLEYGIVGMNDGLPSVAQAPFGGFKESGLGREGGRWGLEAFQEIKYVSLALPGD